MAELSPHERNCMKASNIYYLALFLGKACWPLTYAKNFLHLTMLWFLSFCCRSPGITHLEDEQGVDSAGTVLITELLSACGLSSSKRLDDISLHAGNISPSAQVFIKLLFASSSLKFPQTKQATWASPRLNVQGHYLWYEYWEAPKVIMYHTGIQYLLLNEYVQQGLWENRVYSATHCTKI